MRLKLSQETKWKLEYVAARAVICFIQILTIQQCAAVARFFSWLAADVIKFRRRVITENLRGVYPQVTDDQIREVSRRMWYHLSMMMMEVVQVPRKVHDSNWRKYVTIPDKREMTERLIDYRPLVAVSGHFGNFEMAGYVIGLLGMPSYSVARPLDNPYLDRFLNAFRELNGQYLLPKDGSATEVQQLLANGEILTLLGDQHAGTKGCWIDFLGRPASCHKAIALFTLDGHAPMMVSYCKHLREPMQFEIGCTGIADPFNLPAELRDVTSLTQWYSHRMGDAIHSDPDQYWWLHKRWKEKPVRQTKKMRESQAA
ncbi:MAG: lysophospholipid acyltransferase family protein [Pirellulaceae bacterium]